MLQWSGFVHGEIPPAVLGLISGFTHTEQGGFAVASRLGSEQSDVHTKGVAGMDPSFGLADLQLAGFAAGVISMSARVPCE